MEPTFAHWTSSCMSLKAGGFNPMIKSEASKDFVKGEKPWKYNSGESISVDFYVCLTMKRIE